ncbi:DUF4232 domain-containing protein [Enterobacter asburiae]|uniref:DUF4232 domain-containing protein n=1 Tax=Enterobacterales TaxID=91347 RepID=UPI0013DAD1A6|nr:DUF4232 domain-containing protein [Serratia marcescens]
MFKLKFNSVTFLCLLPVASALADSTPILPCRSADIRLHTDDRNGLYDGMSQDGLSLVLYNAGEAPCMLPPRPALSFSDVEHRPLTAERRTARGMYPGPALPPVIVPAGEALQILLRWVASDAFDGSHCIRPAFVSLALDGGALSAPFNRTMCTVKGQIGYYSQSLTGTP